MVSLLIQPKVPDGGIRLGTTRVHFKNVLLATDFSKGSEAALQAAKAVAKEFQSNLFIVNVIIPGVYPVMTGGEQFLLDAQVKGAEDNMQNFLTQTDLKGIHYESMVQWGASIVDSLIETIHEKHIDLVVASSHGAMGIERMLLGSVAETIMRNVHCPVMVVGPNVKLQNMKFRSMLLATDLSYQSLRSAQYAVALAEEMNADLTLMHVLDSEDKHRNLPDSVYTEMERLLPPDADRWCNPKLRVETGDVAKHVLEAAVLDNADLIVIATKDKTMMADHAPWSHFSHIVCDARCPVLAVQKHL